MTEINKNQIRWDIEIEKMRAETTKIQAETQLIVLQRAALPFATGAVTVGAVAAFLRLFFS